MSRPIRPRLGVCAGYTAAAWAFAFAALSLYWAAGGTRAAETVLGPQATHYSWATDPAVMTATLLAGLLKILGGLFAIALVRPSWPRAPRWMMFAVGWGAALLLVGYGLEATTSQALVTVHAIHVPADYNWHTARWHLCVWGPVFAVWGVLLGLAVRDYQSNGLSSRPSATDTPAR